MESLAKRAKNTVLPTVKNARLKSIIETATEEESIVAFSYLASHGMKQSLFPEKVIKNLKAITQSLKGMQVNVDDYALMCYSEFLLACSS